MHKQEALEFQEQSKLDRYRIRQGIVRELRVLIEDGYSATTAHAWAWDQYVARCEDKSLEVKGVRLTIGDVDAEGFAQEEGYGDLPAELGIVEGDVLTRIREREIEIQKSCAERGKPIHCYQRQELPELKTAAAAYLQRFGLTVSEESVRYSNGGGYQASGHILEALSKLKTNKGQVSNFLAAVPTYSPIVDKARETQGMKVVTMESGLDDFYDLPPGNVEELVRENDIGVIYLVVPVKNPTASMLPPERIKQIAVEAKKANPDVHFFIDMAYADTVDPDITKNTLGALNEAGVLENCVLMTSFSKGYARPGDRHALSYLLDPELIQYYERSEVGVNPYPSGVAMAGAAAILECVPIKAIERVKELYDKRTQALAEMLSLIKNNSDQQIFSDQGVNKGALYVYAQLNKGIVDSLTVFEETGLLGIGGWAFGALKDRGVRMAVGAMTIEKIKKIPQMLDL